MSLVLGSWSLLSVNHWPSANDAAKNNRRACVHGHAGAMWDARTDHARVCNAVHVAVLYDQFGGSVAPRSARPRKSQGTRAIDHACARLMHKEQSTPEAKSHAGTRDQGPCKSQGIRSKDQEPKTKSLPCIDPHAAKYIKIHAGTKDLLV